jgi:hypothetical protein
VGGDLSGGCRIIVDRIDVNWFGLPGRQGISGGNLGLQDTLVWPYVSHDPPAQVVAERTQVAVVVDDLPTATCMGTQNIGVGASRVNVSEPHPAIVAPGLVRDKQLGWRSWSSDACAERIILYTASCDKRLAPIVLGDVALVGEAQQLSLTAKPLLVSRGV